jgi:hypothetical protein
MAPHHGFTPTVHNAGVSMTDLNESLKASSALQDQINKYRNLAIVYDDRFHALIPRYRELLNEFGPEVADLLAQVRSDILRSLVEEWDWRSSLDATGTFMEYVGFCDSLIEHALTYIGADERIKKLTGGNKRRQHRLTRVLITQLLTYIEATRLPGLNLLPTYPWDTSR